MLNPRVSLLGFGEDVIATNSRVVRDSLGARSVCHANAQIPVAELGCVSNLFQMSTRLSIYVTYVDSDYLMGLRYWSIPPSCYHVYLVLVTCPLLVDFDCAFVSRLSQLERWSASKHRWIAPDVPLSPFR